MEKEMESRKIHVARKDTRWDKEKNIAYCDNISHIYIEYTLC